MKRSNKSARPAIPHSETTAHYQARDDMHVLKQAAQIKADGKRHSAAKDMARTEAGHLRKVAGRK